MKIDIPDLPGNSTLEKSREQEKPNNSGIVQGRLKPTKRRLRLSEVFTPEDTGSVAAFVITKLVIPRLQVLAVDTINAVARAIFLGEKTYEPRRSSSSTEYTSYEGYYSGKSARIGKSTKKVDGAIEFQDVVVDSYGDAQLILNKLDELMDYQGYVRVSEFYEAAKLPCPFTGSYYGWEDISGVRIVADSDGYRIEMPTAKPLKD